MPAKPTQAEQDEHYAQAMQPIVHGANMDVNLHMRLSLKPEVGVSKKDLTILVCKCKTGAWTQVTGEGHECRAFCTGLATIVVEVRFDEGSRSEWTLWRTRGQGTDSVLEESSGRETRDNVDWSEPLPRGWFDTHDACRGTEFKMMGHQATHRKALSSC